MVREGAPPGPAPRPGRGGSFSREPRASAGGSARPRLAAKRERNRGLTPPARPIPTGRLQSARPSTTLYARPQRTVEGVMASKKVRVAIVGLGFGAEFIPIYQAHPDAEMYAICQRNQASLNQVGDQLGVAKRYANFDELIKDANVDAVHINSPIPDHAWMSMR